MSPVSPSLSAPNSTEQLQRLRHTCAHVMAMAVQHLFPETKVTIGPTTETGCYYDFDRAQAFTPADLDAIATQMRRIIKANLPIIREQVDRDQMMAELEQLQEPYKLEILAQIPVKETITRYFIGSPDTGRTQHPEAEASLIDPLPVAPSEFWWDLCSGPHLNSTGELNSNAFVLESVAGAYWRGDETQAQLQRIYGTAWKTPEQLQAYLYQKEEAQRRDHRLLGKTLKLFSIEDNAGGGPGLFHSKNLH